MTDIDVVSVPVVLEQVWKLAFFFFFFFFLLGTKKKPTKPTIFLTRQKNCNNTD